MTADTLKSASITNADASPVVRTNAGKGPGDVLREASDYVTPTAAGLKDTGSKYKLVRLPWHAKLKEITLFADAALDTSTGLAVDLGTYYSDGDSDGLIDKSLSGTNAGAVDNLLAASTGFQSSALKVDVTAVVGKLTVEKRNKELWDAIGLSKNPGGFCDIVMAVHTAATSPGASGNGATFGISVKYVD